MKFLFSWALLALPVWLVAADPKDEPIEEIQEEIKNARGSVNPHTLNISVSVAFPQSEIFGIKLVNGHPTQAILGFDNGEPEPVTVQLIGGSLWTPDVGPEPRQLLRNLSATSYGVKIPAGEKETLAYSFATEMHPQDLTLNLVAVLMDAKREAYYTFEAFNQTVSVVEAPISMFDPQIIFLYLVLGAAFGGTCYFIYTTWITTLFPQMKRGGKGGERAKRSSAGSKKVDPSDQTSVIGADGSAVTSGAQAFDEWIPAHHLNRPEPKRTGSGKPKSKKAA